MLTVTVNFYFDRHPLYFTGHNKLLFAVHGFHKHFIALNSVDDIFCLNVIGFKLTIPFEQLWIFGFEHIKCSFKMCINV